ncbi:MAG: T9SS type A sorting domain-containing protein [Planctomycetes bacterium]|nr:T9SS type A sorting domain-containing protein [Planctomycetota bacterium]
MKIRWLMNYIVFFLILNVNVFAQTWIERAPLPTMRWNPDCVTLDGKIYVLGGQSETSPHMAISTVEAYDPDTDTWQTCASMPTPRWGLMATTWNGLIYAIGGMTGNFPGTSDDPVEVYDPETDSWSDVSTLTPMPTGRGWGGCATIGDTIYVFGGYISTGFQTSPAVDKYSVISDTWTSDPPMPILRDCFMNGVVNDKIYVIGGWSEYQDVADLVQEYDPVAKVWTEKTPMPTARFFTDATVWNNKIIVAGGRGDDGDEFESYDPATDSWTIWEPMLIAREGLALGTIGDRVFITAGSAVAGYPFYDEMFEVTNLDIDSIDEMPTGSSYFGLSQNYPNPFNPVTMIRLNLPQKERVALRIYDVSGAFVKTLFNNEREAGSHTFTWDGTDHDGHQVASGLYLYEVHAGNYHSAKRMILMK